MVYPVSPVRRDPLIIGGGPAGTAAAITLGRAGHRPILIERSVSPVDKVCGDFLSVDTIQRIRFLGVDPVRLGAAPIFRVRVTKDDRTVEAALPFPAFGLSRRVLDAALLACAEGSGAVVRAGQTVRHLTRHAGHWIARTAQAEVEAETVFLATGKHDLRDYPRAPPGGGSIGMKTYLRLSASARDRLIGATELFLFPGGYAGFQPVEDGRAVLCIAVRKLAFQAYGGHWTGLIEAIERRSGRFAAMMADGCALLPRPLAVAGVPYGYRAEASEGLFRLGDQAAVIPSLTGDGMAIALFSGQRAAEAWLAGGDAASYQRDLARTLAPQMRLAGLLHRVGQGDATQTGAIHVLRLFPGLLRQAATHTRLPGHTEAAL